MDVSEYDKLETFREQYGLEGNITHVFTTHKHKDHSGANGKIRAVYGHKGVVIVGGEVDSQDIPGCNKKVKHKDRI